MDFRGNIVQEVVTALKELSVEDVVIDIVQDVLVVQLNEYEVQKRCTDLEVLDTSAERALKKFIGTKRLEGIADSTLRRYADENLKLIRFLRKPLYEVTTYDLRFYLSYRRQQGKVSNRTLDGMRRCYSSFFGWLAAEGMIGRNPCAALSQIKYRKMVKKPFSAVELEKIRKACQTERDIAIVDFLYATGCRVSEVVALDISDIDFDNLECRVLGKGNKERIVYLSPVAAMHLQEYLRSRCDFSEALFAGKGSERIGKNGIEALLKRIGKAAGV